jgi:hypothetical protein
MIRHRFTETAAVLRHQIGSMGSPRYEIGIYRRNANQGRGAMLLRDWDSVTLLHSVGWLRFENQQDCDIYIRPAGPPHNLTLVDDLSSEAVATMKNSGFEPALVLETSPRNFQAWLKHPAPLDKQTSTAAARALAQKFGGDTGAADWRHFGRLAGFENRKPSRRDVVTGAYPFVRLVENSGGYYPEGVKFIAGVKSKLEEMCQRQERLRMLTAARPPGGRMKSIEMFRNDPRYEGDGKRCDLAYAIYAFAHGADATQVEAAIRSRDLSHRGPERRQNEYVQRTIRKALEGAGRSR